MPSFLLAVVPIISQIRISTNRRDIPGNSSRKTTVKFVFAMGETLWGFINPRTFLFAGA